MNDSTTQKKPSALALKIAATVTARMTCFPPASADNIVAAVDAEIAPLVRALDRLASHAEAHGMGWEEDSDHPDTIIRIAREALARVKGGQS